MIKVVAALITNQDKVLLAKRARGNLIGSWEFPGGKIEPPESSDDAIEREIMEELGINVTAQTSVNTFSHEYDFGVVQLELIQCNLQQDIGDIMLDGSHSQITFVDPNSDIKLELAPLDQKILNYLSR